MEYVMAGVALRINLAVQLGSNNWGYLFVGYLEDLKNKRDDRGFKNLDYFSSSELKETIRRVIESF
ncbi:MAG: hypothetical protein GXY96_10955 [Tissierellia bacterium]|nr:hypothetical protein [Tissierellia bacterium]